MDIKNPFGQASKYLHVDATKVLREVLHLGINGGRGLSSAKELGNKYLENPKYQTQQEMINALIRTEVYKSFTTGFLTNLGGALTLPVSIPASLGINWVLQTRMVAAMAHIGGFNIDEPGIRMAIALSLLGNKGKELLNANLKEMDQVLFRNVISNLPKKTIFLLKQAIAKKMINIATQRGFSRVSKVIPIMRGVVGGMVDYHSCKETAEFAKELFQFDSHFDI
ncbi:MAG: hypothetical protein COB67_00960 [SAR324 cluster bacterium]|uniref:EcsC family protein n=1 Tax=SAR324 cluster bacterium TaxID=2024889 RepID=A0A2A4TBL2_9DELT|nr:MAG: hypothetical protein COB67_00960 [SAR324 cluster bacterium]